MLTIIYLALVVMCLLPRFFYNRSDESNNFDRTCIIGMICSGLCFFWSIHKLITYVTLGDELRAAIRRVKSNPLVEEMLWIYDSNIIRDSELLASWLSFLTIASLVVIIISIIAFIKYRKYYGTCSKICPKCCEKIKSGAIVCRFCGYEFETEEVEEEPAKPQELSTDSIAYMAQMEGLSTDEFLQKIGLQNSGLTETSTEEDLFNKLTIENYAKFSDKDIDEFKSMLGIDTLDNSMLWMEAQMLIKLKKIAKVEFGMDFEEFAEANALPPEITGDTTYGDAIPFLGNM